MGGAEELQEEGIVCEVSPPEDPGNPTVDFRGEKRTNQTHQSTTDSEARLYRKPRGHEARLVYMGHALMENRNGLIVNTRVTQATGTAEREAALVMGGKMDGPATLGGERYFDTKDFVHRCRDRDITPHVAQNTTNRSSTIDGRVTSHPGYFASEKKRKLIEEFSGWIRTVDLMRKTRHRKTALICWMFQLNAAAYNLVRLRNLCAKAA